MLVFMFVFMVDIAVGLLGLAAVLEEEEAEDGFFDLSFCFLDEEGEGDGVREVRDELPPVAVRVDGFGPGGGIVLLTLMLMLIATYDYS